jgi:hypothetical protein
VPAQHRERVADATQLLPVTAHLVENLLFQFGVSAPAEVDVDQSDLAACRPEFPGLGIRVGLYRLPQTRTEPGHGISPAKGPDADHPASRQTMQGDSASLSGKEAQIIPPLIAMTCPEMYAA